MCDDFVNSRAIRTVIEKYGIQDPLSIEGIDVHKYVYRLYGTGTKHDNKFKSRADSAKYLCIYQIDTDNRTSANNLIINVSKRGYIRDNREYMYMDQLINHVENIRDSSKRPIVEELQKAIENTPRTIPGITIENELLRTIDRSMSDNQKIIYYVEEIKQLTNLLADTKQIIEVLMANIDENKLEKIFGKEDLVLVHQDP